MSKKDNNLNYALITIAYIIVKAIKKDSDYNLMSFCTEYISVKKEIQNLNVDR